MNSFRLKMAATVALSAIWLVAGCSADSSVNSSGAPSGAAQESSSSTATTTAEPPAEVENAEDAVNQAEEDAGPDETGDEDGVPSGDIDTTPLVRAYAEAVVDQRSNESAAPGSPAELYLDHLIRVQQLGGVATLGPVGEDGFVVVAANDFGEESTFTFTEVVVGPLGVEDFTVNGNRMSDRISTVLTATSTAEGLSVEEGSSYITASNERITTIAVRNGLSEDLNVQTFESVFIQTDGRQETNDGSSGFISPTIIAAGATADIALITPGRNADPDGVAKLKFSSQDFMQTFEIEVPLGNTQPSFFSIDPSTGDVKGELSADIAFATGSSGLSDEAFRILSQARAEIDRLDRPDDDLCIEGHADSVGDEATNLSLSEARAESVATALRDLGVTHKIDAIGYGEKFAPGDEQPDVNARRVDVSFSTC